jgi:class 3 adenylate cyclase/tetratricopeptide (TPR) repeat protein
MNCPRCGQDNPGHHNFCHACGTRLADRSGPEGAERKPVTILFCDIVGSTPLAERIGAERMHRLVNEFSAAVFPVVHAYGGSVNQFMGDGFMALFGAPMVHEDHAVRAGLAALEIRDRVAHQAWQSLPAGESLRIRIGLNGGVVVFGSVGDDRRSEITAIGDAANVAARLQSIADPGTVVASAAVAASLVGEIDTRMLGVRQLKGKSEALEVFELHGRTETRGSPRGRDAAFHGREREAKLFDDALADLAQGRAGLLVVEGAAGLGKSRLLAWARERALERGIGWHQGTSRAYGEAQAYLPFREALRSALGLESRAVGWSALLRQIEAVLGSDARRFAPFVAQLTGVAPDYTARARLATLDAQATGLQLFHTVLRLLEGLGRRAPCVIAFDDWQWADASSFALLEHLLAHGMHASTLFVVAMRPPDGGSPRRDAPGAACPPGTPVRRMSLSPLGTDAQNALLTQSFEGARIHPALAEFIVSRSGGNPFYLQQIARALRAAGGLTRDVDGQWRLASSGMSFELPDGIDGLILAQVDRLDAPAKELLKLAVVAGTMVPLALLEAVAGRDGLGRHLDALLQSRLLESRDAGMQGPMVFAHPLVQQSVYGSLLEEQRRVLHARIADALLAEAGEDDDGHRSAELAHHLVGAERWIEARDRLLEAGERAARIAADAEALSQFERALEAVRTSGRALDLVTHARLRAGIAEALYRLGRNDAALGHAVAALQSLGHAMPESRGAVRREIAAALARGTLRGLLRRVGLSRTIASEKLDKAYEVSSRLFEVVGTIDYFRDPERFALGILHMLVLAEERPPSRAQAIGTAALALICDMLSLPQAAVWLHGRAAQIARDCDDAVAQGYCCQMRGLHEYARGEWRTALTVLEDGTRHLEAVGHWRLWSSCIGVQYIVLRSMGDPKWLDLARRQREMAESTGDRHALAWATNAEGVGALYRGDAHAALPHFEKAALAYEAIPDYRFLAGALARRGLCHALMGEYDAARPLLARAEQLRRRYRVAGIAATAPLIAIAEADLVIAEHAAIKGRAFEHAQAACYRAMRHARGVRDESGADAARLEGRRLWLAGERDAAMAMWREGIQMARRLGARQALACLHHEIARRSGDGAHAEEARLLFASTGGAPLVPGRA